MPGPDGGADDQRWTRRPAPVVPDYIRGQLERRGYRVEQRRGLVAMDLEDGRRLAIPVAEVEVRYVGSRTF